MTSLKTHRLPDPSLMIGDQRISSASGGVHQHLYPGTGETTGVIPLAGATEVDAAVRAARNAFTTWRTTPVNERRKAMLRLASLIRKHAEELETLCTLENGTASAFAATYPELVADLFEYNAGWADKIGGEVVPTWPIRALDYVREEPYGVVAIIIPWNSPFASAGMTVAPALAAGNCVVIKPPELAPWSVIRFGELALEAGFPPGVINVVPGAAEAGDAMVRHTDIDFLHFTGSGDTGRKIMAAAADSLKPVGFELGGKSARVIFEDANITGALIETVGNLVALSGQGCLYGMRLLVQDTIYDQVVSMIGEFTQGIAMGDPFDVATQMGPVISNGAAERILGFVERAKADGSVLIAGGGRAGGDLEGGYFIEPTVFADVSPTSELAREEVFGPIVAITKFSGEDEAVRLANSVDFGLAAYVWTNDVRRAHTMAERLEAGNIFINGFMGLPPSAPFGGHKRSGFGRLGGREGIREFTRTKNVWMPLGEMPSMG